MGAAPSCEGDNPDQFFIQSKFLVFFQIGLHYAGIILNFFASGVYVLNSSERLTTVTELSAIANAASSGRNVMPSEGYRTPAATGINAELYAKAQKILPRILPITFLDS